MRISIIGTGHVAHTLGKVFLKAGHEITWVYGRNKTKVALLARKLHCIPVQKTIDSAKYLQEVTLIAVSDDAISDISLKFKNIKNIIVHTSGSVDIAVLKKNHTSAGVFYPLQTFSDGGMINFRTTPVCLETNTEKDLILLRQLASSVSDSVYVINSRQRLKIHLAAVIANNFTNHLFSIAEDILEENKLSFDILKPIILSSCKNLMHHSPAVLQTGPAKRGDRQTITKHLDILKSHPDWHLIYKILSESIKKKFK